MTDYLIPILLLLISNSFMTIAWYGHLKFGGKPIWFFILVSWGIAFFEYCFQVPANRMGVKVYSPFQLKIMAEVMALVLFTVFAVFYLNEPIKWNYIVSFLFILGAVYFAFAFK